MENNLFTKAAFDDLKMDVKKTERVVVDTSITIDGVTFDLEDLYKSATEVADGDAYITEKPMADMLLKYGVLSSTGSRWSGGDKGPNYEAFLNMIWKHM